MKLLADLPAVDEEEPPHRPVQAILGGAVVLLIMLGVGILLLVAGGDDDPSGNAGQAPAASEGQDPEATVDLASWTADASAACRAAADEHPAFANPEEAPVVELDAAVRTLTSTVREIPLPTATESRATALDAVAKGDAAEQAWDAVAGQQRDDVSRSELADATGSTEAFVTSLVEVGAEKPPERGQPASWRSTSSV